MSDTFRALVANKDDDGYTVDYKTLTDADLGDGDVTVAIEYSTVNYKDGLAITGASPICRSFPMTLGIDFAGTVIASDHADWKAGDKVIANGFGLSETHNGGYAERARVNGDMLVSLPAAFSARQAMAIGTAGYTAMLCVMRLEAAGITPDKGDILVTGANGGVGTVAISILSKLGYSVVASTGRMAEADFLKTLGAADVLDRTEFSEKGRPLGKMRFAGAVDSVGSTTLANVLAQVNYEGAVAACGLAQGFDLPATVMPFILRNVALLGVDSVMAPPAKRREAWRRLAEDLDVGKLDALTVEVAFDDLATAAKDILAGQIRGRAVVPIRR